MMDGELDRVPSVLACDVGNTHVQLACVQGETAGEVRTVRVGELAGLGEVLGAVWPDIEPPRKIVAASVNPAALKALEAAVGEALDEPVLVVGRDLPLPLDTAVTEPQHVGVDRVCAAAAAFDRLGVPCVVADFGTAITIDCVGPEGVFLGGAILPGLGMGAAALAGGTAQLPAVTPRDPTWVFGGNTEEAMIGGLVFAARGALRMLVESYATELGQWPLVIATGGDADLVCTADGTRELIQAVVGDLVLRGVAMAYYRALLQS